MQIPRWPRLKVTIIGNVIANIYAMPINFDRLAICRFTSNVSIVPGI
jgi:hypothetical protein